MYTETGRFPTAIRYKIKMLKYWSRLTRLPESSRVKQIYKLLREMSELGYKTWVSNTQNLMYENQLEVVYDKDYIMVKDEIDSYLSFNVTP